MTSEILKFTEKPIIDESIQEYEYHEYEPQREQTLTAPVKLSSTLNYKIYSVTRAKLFGFRRPSDERRRHRLRECRRGCVDEQRNNVPV